RGDLPPPGRLLRRPLAAVRGAVSSARGGPAGRRRRSRPEVGPAAAPARGAPLPRARRRRVVRRRRRRTRAARRLPRALGGRAGGADERGAASLGPPAGVPLGGRRPPARPARARAVRRPQPALGPLPLPLLDGPLGRRPARARR